MMRLFGRVSKTSTASRGVAAFIASIPATPASLFHAQENKKASKIRATSGRTSRASSAKLRRNGSSSKTSPITSASDFTQSPASYERWVIESRRDCLARLKSARLTSGNDCLSWHTPDSGVFNDGESPVTFLARKEKLKLKKYNGNGATTPLAMEVKMWHTPHGMSNQDHSGKMGAGGEFAKQATNWPTANSHDATGARGKGFELTDHHYKPHDLVAATVLYLQTEAIRFSLPALKTSKRGANFSDGTPRLNPRFVEMLMNFPLGWTDANRPLALIDYERWATLCSRSLRRLVL